MRFVLAPVGHVESELLHTYNSVDPFDILILCVRVAVLTAVTLTVPIVLFPVSNASHGPQGWAAQCRAFHLHIAEPCPASEGVPPSSSNSGALTMSSAWAVLA